MKFNLEKGVTAYESKTIRLSTETIEKIQHLADQNNLSFNNVIQQMVKFALENMEKTE